jgi:glycosyltransferase involved in cell wall biosynthesis
MKILIATSGTPFTNGDAEMLAGNLREAFSAAGHEVEQVFIPFKDYPPGRILDQILFWRLLDLTESCGNRIDRVVGLNFPAYLIPHPNKVIWLLNQHRPAYGPWDRPPACDLADFPDGPMVRDAIRRADRELIPEARAIYAVSQNVAERLSRYCGITSESLYHPPANARLFRKGSVGDYLFFPSPISSVSRHLLAMEAIALCRERVCIRFAGEPGSSTQQIEYAHAVRRLKLAGRIEWLGGISDIEKRDLYANCLGVVLPPADNEYGYVALEAMLSSKPVITCWDSGAPLEFVVAHQTGFVAKPAPESLAQAMDSLWADRRCASAMGEAGRARYQDLRISWANVMEKLLC